ncbi:hypothetical protein [Actinocrispum wychmicini]|uniref:hypothetical protein n=1 Tax=Actinocrispum wychmicini TaxID=1213861 RepID=UPI001FB72F81|nr:hypothetical protein [Actinocrispum wychmicini]
MLDFGEVDIAGQVNVFDRQGSVRYPSKYDCSSVPSGNEYSLLGLSVRCSTGLEDDVGVERFQDDDAGYERWLAAHPDLFVLNTARRPAPNYLMLHRATCRTIAGTPARGNRWTGDYIKFCGRRTELEEFAQAQVGGTAFRCRLCL